MPPTRVVFFVVTLSGGGVRIPQTTILLKGYFLVKPLKKLDNYAIFILHSKQKEDDMRIKVICFNIRSTHDENGNSIPERAPRLSFIVKPYDADVIGLQEYTSLWEICLSFCWRQAFYLPT